MIILASSSPRRRALLEQIGVAFTSVETSVDETPLAAETPDAYVRRLALAKARAGAVPGVRVPVLGADTAVVLDGDILQKPGSRDEALAMMARLSGRIHRVMTAVAIVGARESVCLASAEVEFRTVTETEADAYWASGEPRGKAGGYAIQGLGAIFVRRIAGSYSAVVGLPLYETAELLREHGIDVLGSVR